MDKAQVKKVIDIKKDLDKINFDNVLLEDSKGIGHSYNLTNKANQHSYTKGAVPPFCCTICDEKGWHLPKDNDPNKQHPHSLKNVSHGTHTFDYLQACGKDLGSFPFSDWSDIPVLFLFENPSNDQGLYKDSFHKRPAKRWYWVSDDCDGINFAAYPNNKDEKDKHTNYFKGGYYGGMVYSLIDLFKLGNAYVTNVVKCGMNNNNGDGYLDTSQYNPECIKSCLEKILKEEIKALTNQGQKPLIIFAFGNRTYDLIYNSGINANTKLIKMPHPASRLNDDYRKYVIFGKAYVALKAISDDSVAKDALKRFITEMA